MASKYWIKLYHEIIHDPKMGRLPDHLWRRVIELFLIAGEFDHNGELPELGDMAWLLKTTEEELTKDLEAISITNIVTLRDGRCHIKNFAKRQAALSDAERQQRKRDRERFDPLNGSNGAESPGFSNEEITEGVTIRDIDTDTDTELKDIAAFAAPPPPDPFPPDAPERPVKPTKPSKQLSDRKPPVGHPEVERLERVFSETRGVPLPDWKADPKGAQKTWRTPCKTMLTRCGGDPELAEQTLRQAVKEMMRGRLTFSKPIQVMETFESKLADRTTPAALETLGPYIGS